MPSLSLPQLHTLPLLLCLALYECVLLPPRMVRLIRARQSEQEQTLSNVDTIDFHIAQ